LRGLARGLGREDFPAQLGVERVENRWKAELGCEVKVCEAGLCDRGRMEVCALRAAYLERRAELRKRLAECRSERLRDVIKGMLREMGVAQIENGELKIENEGGTRG